MKSHREYTDYLQDILDATTKARQFVKDLEFEAFRANDEKVFPLSELWKLLVRLQRTFPSQYVRDTTRYLGKILLGCEIR